MGCVSMLSTGVDIFSTAQNVLDALGHTKETLSKLNCTFTVREKTSLKDLPFISFSHQFNFSIDTPFDLKPFLSHLSSSDLKLYRISNEKWAISGNELSSSRSISNEENVQSILNSVSRHLDSIERRYESYENFMKAFEDYQQYLAQEEAVLSSLYPLFYIGNPDYTGDHFRYATVDKEHEIMIANCIDFEQWYFYGTNNSGFDLPFNSLWENKRYDSESQCVFAAQVWIAKNKKRS